MSASRYVPGPKAGLVLVLLSAVCFSLAGVLIKLVPWGALSVSAGRSLFAVLVIYLFMRWQGRRLVINKAVLIGAAFNFVMSQTFVFANKLTTAANAIVLQFTEPVFAILIIYCSKMHLKEHLIASALYSSAEGSIYRTAGTKIKKIDTVIDSLAYYGFYFIGGSVLYSAHPKSENAKLLIFITARQLPVFHISLLIAFAYLFNYTTTEAGLQY